MFLESKSTGKSLSTGEKIKELEDELKKLKDKVPGKAYNAESKSYGSGPTLERFMNKKINRTKNPDLKPIDRKPKKDS